MVEHKRKPHEKHKDDGVEEGQVVEQSPELSEEYRTETSLPGTASLQEELAQARQKADEYLDGWQRATADLQNYRRRVERDQAQTYQIAAGSVARRFLEALDDLERALANMPTGDAAGWADGIELIYRKLLNVLEAEGITRMDIQPGQDFDPNLFEAITHEDNPAFQSGHVIGVVNPGYMIKDRVLRPARVRVAR